MSVFQKKCPMCGECICYKSRHALTNSIRWNSSCRRCAVSKSHKESPRQFFKTEEYKSTMSLSLKEVRHTDSYGEEFKRKCRENKLKQIQQQGVQRTYNPSACRFMADINVQFGWNLQHAMNGGEVHSVGYSLDGYDANRNIVFEYDEPKHRTLSLSKKDKERERRIIAALHPSAFFRYDEKFKRLVEIITNKEVTCQLR